MMGLSSNFGNMFSVLGAVLFLPFLPMLPIQILLNNFLYDFGQLTIPSDKVDSEFIKKPKHWDIRFIKKFMFIFGPISSIFDFISFYVLFNLFKNTPALFQTGWFMESLATQTLVIHIVRTRKIPILQSSASIYLWISTLTVVAIGWILPGTSLGKMFNLAALPLPAIVMLAGIVLVYLIFVEIGKKIFYSKLYAS
jgi:Mg2+-importing ATPase